MELERIEQHARGWAVEFADRNDGVPVTWSRILIVERPSMPSDGSVTGARLYTPEEYTPRFAQIAREARCDWINFGAEGVLDDALVLIVDHGWDYPVGRTAGNLHVMPCGPWIDRGFVKYQEPDQ
jgi:hypothetical protein